MSKDKGKSKNVVTIKVGQLPGRVVELTVPKGTTIAGAFESAQLDPKSNLAEVTCNGQPTSLDAKVKDNDTVLAVEKIRGA